MPTTDEREDCVGCGRDTQSGTRLFSDRGTTRGEDAIARYLCGDCNERAVRHFGRKPTERDMAQIAARGAGLSPGIGGGAG
jgi:hypothetical protein